MEKYLAAWTSLNENTFVNDPTLSVVDRGYLHGIQGTWRVRKPDWSIQSHDLQIMLVWDYDRIWGSFDLVDYKGILMVDHGPRHEPPEQRSSPAYCNFTWREKCTRNHSALINTPLVAKGKIELGSSWIRGYFDGMTDEDSDHRHFEGKPSMGPRRAPRSVQSFIDEWNKLGLETIRLPPTAGTVAISGRGDSGHTLEVKQDNEEKDRYEDEDAEDEDLEDDDEDGYSDENKEPLWYLDGLYAHTSHTFSAEWPDRAKFLMGIFEGYLSSRSSLSGFDYGVPFKLDYRCRERGTVTTMRGVAEMTLFRDRRIRGSFDDMYSTVRFEGKGKLMPSGISGRDLWYYRQGWEEYGHHLDRWR